MNKKKGPKVLKHPASKLEELLDRFQEVPDKNLLLECTVYAIQNALDPRRLEKIVYGLVKKNETLGLSTDDILDTLGGIEISKVITLQEQHDEDQGPNEFNKEEFLAKWNETCPTREGELKYFIAGDHLLPLLPPSIKSTATTVFRRIEDYLCAFVHEEEEGECAMLCRMMSKCSGIDPYNKIIVGLLALALYEQIENDMLNVDAEWLFILLAFSQEIPAYKNKENALKIVESDNAGYFSDVFPLICWLDSLGICAQDFREVVSDEIKSSVFEQVHSLIEGRGYAHRDEGCFVRSFSLFVFLFYVNDVLDEDQAWELLEWLIDNVKESFETALDSGSLSWDRSTIELLYETTSEFIDIEDDGWLFPFFLGDIEPAGTALSLFYFPPSIEYHLYVIDELLQHGWHGFAEAMIFSMFVQLPFLLSYHGDHRKCFGCGSWSRLRKVLDYCRNTSSEELEVALRYCSREMQELGWFKGRDIRPQCLELKSFLEEVADQSDQRPASLAVIMHQRREQSKEQFLYSHVDTDDLSRLSDNCRDLLAVAFEQTRVFFNDLQEIIERKKPDHSFLTIISFGKFLEVALKEIMSKIYEQFEQANIRSFLREDKDAFSLYSMLEFIRRYPNLSRQEKTILDDTGFTLQKDLHLATLLDNIARKTRNKAAHDAKYSWKDTANCLETLLGEEQALKRFIRCLPKP